MVAGGLLVFLNTMKELPATLLLRPSGFETVAVRIWSATGEGLLTRASAAALVLLLISAIPLLVVMTRDIGD
jgi:iron(III) transport system permease protein